MTARRAPGQTRRQAGPIAREPLAPGGWARPGRRPGGAALALLAAAACGPSPTPRTEAAVAVPAPDTAAAASEPAAAGLTPMRARSMLWRVRVGWELEDASPGCFFFSGPGGLEGLSVREPLGPLARLERRDGEVTLTFDEGGQLRGDDRGERLVLRRESSREYRRSTWTTREQIEGTRHGAVVEGRYSYEECDRSGKEGCPGRCRLTARLVTRATTAP